MLKVALCGDSNCRGLIGMSKRELSSYNIRNFGVSGFTSSDLFHSIILTEISEWNPDVVVIILSGNDIKPRMDINCVLNNFCGIADYFNSKNITVRFSQLFFRNKPRNLSIEQYNKICNLINRKMKKILPKMTFYSGICQSKAEFLLKCDGVHLSFYGKQLFLRKIKTQLECL